MSQLFIIAHAPLAAAFQAVAAHLFAETMQEQPWLLSSYDVAAGADADQSHDEAAVRLDGWLRPSSAAGVSGPADALLLTDVFGATPYNIARRLADARNLRVLVGLSVPMLWRAIDYRDRSSEELAALAAAGAIKGVMQFTATRPQNQAQRPGSHEAIDGHHQQ